MSLQSLTRKDEVWIFATQTSRDDMMGAIEAQSARRRAVRCRMVPISATSQLVQERPELVEGYQAYFAADPEVTLGNTLVYKGDAYEVVGVIDLGGMGWLWEITLQRHPGAEITV